MDLRKNCLYNFYEQEINYHNKVGTHGQLIEEYVKLIQQLWINENYDKKPINPNKFRIIFSRKIPQFTSLNQQDSH